jgi:ribose 5-phosphate isomerase B
MKVYLASDHTGFSIKEKVKILLKEKGFQVEDCGAFTYNPEDDYPLFMHEAAVKVSQDDGSRGIIFGGSGQGEAMVANKVKGIRCALFYTPATPVQAINIEGTKSDNPLEILTLTRQHNGANMLSLGVRFLSEDTIFKAIPLWLDAQDPVKESHLRRIHQMSEFEK